ncbi:MAG: DUF4105 domain-containing protein, partial [Caulobacterales bacterium]|nr:DUF4105 domain-containing protein [Caulobacterales bacterium]
MPRDTGEGAAERRPLVALAARRVAALAIAPFALWAFMAESAAARGVSAAERVAEARALNLADDPTWLKLGRYKRAMGLRARHRSDVVAPGYFLASDGRVDPHAELAATIEALAAPPGPDPDAHALCRYPARAMWLARRLAWDLPSSLEACPAYRAWSRDGAVDGVSVIMVSGYLSNPGSVYGHLLIRFHSGGDHGRHDLLETSMNYGAAASEDDALVPYVVKGLFGGYRSRFSNLEYFHHNARYREAQLRDVWEYHLRLSPEDVAFLVAHSWEMMGAENRYYFLRQNCAYRIAELV